MAFIRYSQRFNGKLGEVVSAEKARAIQDALDNPPDDLSEAKTAYLSNIYAVYHNKGSMIPKTAHKASTRLIDDENTVPTHHLTNTGVIQGKSEALPRGDR